MFSDDPGFCIVAPFTITTPAPSFAGAHAEPFHFNACPDDADCCANFNGEPAVPAPVISADVVMSGDDPVIDCTINRSDVVNDAVYVNTLVTSFAE